jgi:hypothetical protein
MVITSCPLPQNEAERLNTLVSLQPEFTPLDGQFSAGANTVISPSVNSEQSAPTVFLRIRITRFSSFGLNETPAHSLS